MTDNNLHSLGIGIGTRNSRNELIEVYYPLLQLNPAPALNQLLAEATGYEGGNNWLPLSAEQLQWAINATDRAELLESGLRQQLLALLPKLAGSDQCVLVTFIAQDIAPTSIAEVYLKLHLISHRLCKPHTLNLDGQFGILQNLAWTNQGAIEQDDLPERQLQARLKGELLEVMSVDKFPKMTNYVVPRGVRVAHTARVRLGAYLGQGTTVMHEGFVNFNAGTEGPAMVEGRISAGVTIGAGSDLGGGCS